MNSRDDLDRMLSAWLDDPFTPPAPRYLPEVLEQTRHTRQRTAWASIERWLPMALVAHRQGTAPPLRSAWTIALIALLTLAIATAALIIGSRLLRPDDPVQRNNAIIPTLELDTTFDATSIPGLSQPTGMDIGPDGGIYVVNAGTNEILVLGSDGSLIRRWGGTGTGDGQFDFLRDGPSNTGYGGVALTPSGGVFVVDSHNDRVQQLDAGGTFVREWGGFGTGDGQFLQPFDIAAGPDGSVHVVDDQRDDIQRFSGDGDFIETIGSHGTADGQLNSTGSVFVGPDGVVYNADWSNNRVQAWDTDGRYLWSLGSAGTGDGQFDAPGDVGLDAHGNIYVADRQRIQVFSPDLRLLSSWHTPVGTTADGLGGLVVLADGTVLVTVPSDNVIHRLRTLQIQSTTSPSPAATTPPASTAGPATTPVPATPRPSPQAERVRFDATFARPFTVELPPGWTRQWENPGGAEVGKLGSPSNAGFVHVLLPTNAYVDPCRAEDGPMSPPLGPTVDDLVTALTSLPGFRSSEVTEITIDGHPGKTFWLENQLDATGCSHTPWFAQVTYDGGSGAACGTSSSARPSGECFFGPSTRFHQRIAILDVDGTRVMIHSYTFNDTSRTDLIEADRVFESVDFE